MTGRVYKLCGCRDPKTRKQLGAECPKLRAKNHGTWAYVADIGKLPNGKRGQRKRAGFATKKEAQQKLEEVVGKVRRHEPIDDRMTVGEWLTFWLAEKTKPAGASAAGKKIRPNTARVYQQHIDDLLIPQFDPIRLAKFTAEDISRGYDAILAENATKTKGRKFGPVTLLRINACLSSALSAAVKAQRITRNSAAFVTLPETRRPK